MTRVLNYAYDSVGNRQYEHRDNNLGNDDFDYDLNNQLTDFTRSATLGSNSTSAFTFDASGNRSTLVKDGMTTNYTINNLNEYATVTGVANPTYDNNGNLLSYNGATFTYDSMNRLTQAVKSGITEKFYYDGLNRQVARSITGGQTVITVWDGWNVHAEFAPGATNALSVMVYGSGNDLVWGQIVNQYFYPDALGSTVHYANSSGTLLESYSYDHYGKPRVYDPAGNERTGGTIYGMTRLFTGQQWHAATGLYDNRNRFYKADWGRFLQPDPIGFAGDPANLYRYCGNNPANLTDPFGLDAKADPPKKHRDAGGQWGIYVFNKGYAGINLGGGLTFGGPDNPNGLSYQGPPNGNDSLTMAWTNPDGSYSPTPPPDVEIERITVVGQNVNRLWAFTLGDIFGYGSSTQLGHLVHYNNEHPGGAKSRVQFANALDRAAFIPAVAVALPVAVPLAFNAGGYALSASASGYATVLRYGTAAYARALAYPTVVVGVQQWGNAFTSPVWDFSSIAAFRGSAANGVLNQLYTDFTGQPGFGP